MKKSFFCGLLNASRFLTVLYENLPNEIKTDKLYNHIQSYLEKYASLNNISAETAVDIYTNFIKTYNKHCKHFIKYGQYPLENEIISFSINREHYDIVLLLSVLFTSHRFRIMQLIYQKGHSGRALFIGLGPGLELSLTKENLKEVHAYDLSANKFISSEFSDIQLYLELYEGKNENYFDAVFMIELLEHLLDPYMLLEKCCKSLKKGGEIYLTTATNIPQFDHLYNFPKDHSNFEARIKQLGCVVKYKEVIPHDFLAIEIQACNHFYTLVKV